MILLDINKKYIVGNVTIGSPDLDVNCITYIDNLLRSGARSYPKNSTDVRVECSTLLQRLLPVEPHHVPFLLSKDGGCITGYKPLITVPESNIDDVISAGLPNQTWTNIIDDSDPENIISEEIQHTWRTWRSPNYPLGEPIEGAYYFNSNSFGVPLLDTELLIIYNNPTSDLVTSRPVVD